MHELFNELSLTQREEREPLAEVYNSAAHSVEDSLFPMSILDQGPLLIQGWVGLSVALDVSWWAGNQDYNHCAEHVVCY